MDRFRRTRVDEARYTRSGEPTSVQLDGQRAGWVTRSCSQTLRCVSFMPDRGISLPEPGSDLVRCRFLAWKVYRDVDGILRWKPVNLAVTLEEFGSRCTTFAS